MVHGTGVRVAACDLGRATARFVVAEPGSDGCVRPVACRIVAHDGRPAEAFLDWYRSEGIERCAALAATGLHATELVAPAIGPLPEEACREAALASAGAPAGEINVVSVGARGYAALARDAEGRVAHAESEKCSSGTGENVVRIAARFGLGVDEADRLALAAAESVPITARCSVFAKSEITHFANQGRAPDALLRGYLESVARYVAALLDRVRVDGPVWMVGGAARLAALRRALAEALGCEVVVPPDALAFEALGAAAIAAEHARPGARPLPSDPASLVRPKERRFRVLAPANASAGRVTRLHASRASEGAGRAPAVLGLDLGSTGAKAALVAIDTGELVLDIYDRTRGNPVDAARRLVAALLARGSPDVRAVGVTGSGREAVATVLRAAYPALAANIVVENEIVAHATAAIALDPDRGASLSVVEIGGQDAKYVRVEGGRIVESDLNKACSAGTGSFLEEQAVLYGAGDIEQFTRVAATAARPPDLGQMCTVFVAEAAAEARLAGHDAADLFGGFQYAVIHNYLHRVMGPRTFARRVFFQGKPAEGPSLAWTLAAVADREVVVPPNPGAMGAWGIARVARDSLGEALDGAAAFDLARLSRADVVARTEFQCRDRGCATWCRIEKTTVDVEGARATVLSGGACPKYEIATAARPKLPIDAPSAFDEREALLRAFLGSDGDGGGGDVRGSDVRGRAGRPVVGLPIVGALHGVLPWLAAFLRALGVRVRVLRPDHDALVRGEKRTACYDACAPAKIAHGVAGGDGVELLFFPKIVGLPDRDGPPGRTCAVEQGLPEMVREALGAQGGTPAILHPVLDLGAPAPECAAALAGAARTLGAGPCALLRAIDRAAAAQRCYEEGLFAIGRRTLDHARSASLPVVVVCGSLHVVHDGVVNAGIPRILRDQGVLALPMDCYPLPPDAPPLPRVAWADARRALRVACAARARGDAYPLMLSSFGCGPASFAEQVFDALMEGHPHTALESDAHGGRAGYVTRAQAFLHSVRGHDRRPSPAAAGRIALLDPLPERALDDERASRFVVLPFSDRSAPILAAAYRSIGRRAEPCAPNSADALAAGRRDCSGKECLPYQLLWGSFRRHLEAYPPRERTLLLQVTGQGMCRNCMFSVKDRMSLERMGLDDRVAVRHLRADGDAGPALAAKIWSGFVAWGIFQQLLAYHRADVDATPAYEAACDDLERLLADRDRAGVAGALRTLGAIESLVERTARALAAAAAAARDGDGRRTVLLSGDIYVRLDDFAGDGLQRRLAAHGLRVLLEPATLLAEYMIEERLAELFGLPTGPVRNRLFGATMRAARRRLYAQARAHHPWLPEADGRAALRASRALVDRYPQGEAPVTVGSVLASWDARTCDGVVLASPWGCGPAIVAEGLLRRRREIPLLAVYSDGSPIDDRRLAAFAFRLRRVPPRAPA